MFQNLQQAVGDPSLRDWAKASGKQVAHTTIKGWLVGTRPASGERLEEVIVGALKIAEASGRPCPDDLVQQLRRAYAGLPIVDEADWLGDLLVHRVSDDLDEVALGVHRAIARPSAGDRGDARPGSALLPEYLYREVDRIGRAWLAPLAERHATGCKLLILSGEPSVGKTRAALKAVQTVLTGWRLIQPRNANELIGLLEAAVEPRTVLWLDELQRFVGFGPEGDDDGEEAARRLQNLLAKARGPVAVVGTILRTYCDRLLEAPATAELRGSPATNVRAQPSEQPESDLDPRIVFNAPPPAARLLLTGSRLTRVAAVPDRFDHAGLRRADELAVRDPQWRAVVQADRRQGRLAQVIAGGPELVTWYEQRSTPAEKAIVTAALDATRLGCRRPLTVEMLTHAGAGYLHEQVVDEDWFTRALNGATQPVSGGEAPLMLERIGGDDTASGYRPADYLVQYGRRPPQLPPLPPAELWDVLVVHAVDAESARTVGRAALDRGLWRHAVGIHLHAIAAGAPMAELGMLLALQQMGRFAGAEAWSRHQRTDPARATVRARPTNPPVAMSFEPPVVGFAPRAVTTGAEQRAAEAIRSGDPAVMRQVSENLAAEGHHYEADFLAVTAESSAAIDTLGKIQQLTLAGHLDQAIQRLQQLQSDDGFAAVAALARRLEFPEGPQVISGVFTGGEYTVLATLAQALELAGRAPDARALWESSIAAGSAVARWGLAQLLAQIGEPEQAERVWREAAERGDLWARRGLATFLESQRRVEDAIAVWQEIVYDGPVYDLPDQRERVGRHSESMKPVLGTARPAAHELADLLERAGYFDQAEREWWARVNMGDPAAARALVALLNRLGQQHRTDQVWRTALEAGDPSARPELVQLLLANPATCEEAARVAEYGITPGGRPAEPWGIPIPRYTGQERRQRRRIEKRDETESLVDLERKVEQYYQRHPDEVPADDGGSVWLRGVARYLLTAFAVSIGVNPDLALVDTGGGTPSSLVWTPLVLALVIVHGMVRLGIQRIRITVGWETRFRARDAFQLSYRIRVYLVSLALAWPITAGLLQATGAIASLLDETFTIRWSWQTALWIIGIGAANWAGRPIFRARTQPAAIPNSPAEVSATDTSPDPGDEHGTGPELTLVRKSLSLNEQRWLIQFAVAAAGGDAAARSAVEHRIGELRIAYGHHAAPFPTALERVIDGVFSPALFDGLEQDEIDVVVAIVDARHTTTED